MSQNQDKHVVADEVNKIDQSQLESKDLFQISQQNNVHGLQDNIVLGQVQTTDPNHHSDSPDSNIRDRSVNNFKRPSNQQEDYPELQPTQQIRKLEALNGNSPSIGQNQVDLLDDVAGNNSDPSDAGEGDPISVVKTKQKYGHKKQNFTATQTQILKRWFIQNVQNPYLKEENRKELSEKTGLDQRQVSNWFTNVRKRVWQPLKKKYKNKDINDFAYKVRQKLENDGGDQAHYVSSSDQSNHDRFKDLNKMGLGSMKKISKQGFKYSAIEEINASQYQNQNVQQSLQQNNINLYRTQQQNQLQQLQLPSLLSIGQFQNKLQNGMMQAQPQIHQQLPQQQPQLQQPQQIFQPQQQQQERNNQQQQILQFIDKMRRQEEFNKIKDQLCQNINFQRQQSQQTEVARSDQFQISKSLSQIKRELVQPPQSAQTQPAIMKYQQHFQNPQLVDQTANVAFLSQTNGISATGHQQLQKIASQQQTQIPQWAQNAQNTTQLSSNQFINNVSAISSHQPTSIQLPFKQGNLQSSISTIQQSNPLQENNGIDQSQIQSNPILLQQVELLKAQMKEKFHEEMKQNILKEIGQKQSVDMKQSVHSQSKQIPEITKEQIQLQSNIDKHISNHQPRPMTVHNTQVKQKESLIDDTQALTIQPVISKKTGQIEILDNDKIMSKQAQGSAVVEKEKSSANFGNVSDTSIHNNGQRIAMNNYIKNSKYLRFREKMKNVTHWKRYQLDFAQKHLELIQDPFKDEEFFMQNDKIDLEKIEQIDKEFEELENKMEQLAKQKAMEKESENQKNWSSNQQKQKIEDSTKRRLDENDASNDMAEVVSLHHSKSLSNNRSHGSQIEEQKTDNKVNFVNAPFQFIPIVLVSCPNVVKGEKCLCGHEGFYPANDFYKNQFSSFINNQSQILNMFKKEKSSQNNSLRCGQECNESEDIGGSRQHGSSSYLKSNDNSNQQTNGHVNPLHALLNMFNQHANSNTKKNVIEQIANIPMTYPDINQKTSHPVTNLKQQSLKDKNAEMNDGNQLLALPAAPQDEQMQDVKQTTDKDGNEQADKQVQQNQQVAIRESKHKIPPQVNFISHLEQASLLKNQLEVLNEITNQFHELMRLDKIKKKIEQGQNTKESAKPSSDPTEMISNLLNIAETKVDQQISQQGAENLQNIQMDNGQQVLNEMEQQQIQTLKQKLNKSSRTTPSEPAQSSNLNSQQLSNIPSKDQLPIGGSGNNIMVSQQLQSVLNYLNHLQKNNKSDEQSKVQYLQLVNLLKQQQIRNKQLKSGSGDSKFNSGQSHIISNKSLNTDCINMQSMSDNSHLQSTNWQSSKLLRKNFTESVNGVINSQGNQIKQNTDCDQIPHQHKMQFQSSMAVSSNPAQSSNQLQTSTFQQQIDSLQSQQQAIVQNLQANNMQQDIKFENMDIQQQLMLEKLDDRELNKLMIQNQIQHQNSQRHTKTESMPPPPNQINEAQQPTIASQAQSMDQQQMNMSQPDNINKLLKYSQILWK